MCGPVSVNLNGRDAQPPAARASVRQIERAGSDRAFHHRRRPGAEAHAALRAIGDQFIEGDGGAHARHRPHEIFDHPVGLRMIDVEAREFAIAHEIDAGLLLGVDHDARRVDQRLLRRQRQQPVRHRIGADHGGLDARRCGHRQKSLLCDRRQLVSNWLLIAGGLVHWPAAASRTRMTAANSASRALPDRFRDVDHLEEVMTAPSAALVADFAKSSRRSHHSRRRRKDRPDAGAPGQARGAGKARGRRRAFQREGTSRAS